MNLAWLTDIHLNFLRPADVRAFLRTVSEVPADAFLITGDIGEADDLVGHLTALGDAVRRPVYFVLGNHDFYGSSIARVRAEVEALCSDCPNMRWLPSAGVVPLGREACLIGHDGWGDGRLGDYWASDVELSDWELIEDFAGLNRQERLAKLNELGDEAAAHFRAILPDVLGRFRHIVVATHVPPFRESCWHAGRLSDNDWLPHFACRAVGEVLSEVMRAYPGHRMTVLCGHTHGAGEAELLPNLRVLTGGAVYGRPAVQRVLAAF